MPTFSVLDFKHDCLDNCQHSSNSCKTEKVLTQIFTGHYRVHSQHRYKQPDSTISQQLFYCPYKNKQSRQTRINSDESQCSNGDEEVHCEAGAFCDR